MASKLAAYVIGCAFGEKGEPHDADRALRKEFNAVPLQENVWIFSHAGTFGEVRRALGGIIRQGDRFFIVRVSKRSEISLFEPDPAVDLVLDVLGPP